MKRPLMPLSSQTASNLVDTCVAAGNNGSARLQRRPTHYRWVLIVPAVGYLLLFFVAPLVKNFFDSISVAGMTSTGSWSQYYSKLFTETYYRNVVLETIRLSFFTTIICLIIGYPIAYFMVRKAGQWTIFFLFLLVAPLLTSIIMRTFGWQILFARHGIFNDTLMGLGIIQKPLHILNSPLAVYIGMVHVLVPFMVLSIIPVLRSVDLHLEESARVLGAGAMTTLLKVTLPLSKDGIVTGAVLVFMLTSGSFITQLLLGGGSVVTLPLLIFQQFALTQNMSFAAAMGNVLLVIVLCCLFVQLRLTDVTKGYRYE
ncbi:ABC transporter permease [Paralcaligenes ureilyticus]|uniref:Putative spermidine/putrescine transport system permease protein n=1 Tax=Paralcaligenes ureilyticus TaxID=627131 RepID=A0A4R3LT88_9BURK|nr:ABC transporter permease [Paralcaligenes ureilyticus]TCT03076.1 putative spermidine/putrescine transport system permease protein [Paralcaligenes ureilyticus]